MRFGLMFANTGRFATGSGARAIGQAAEAAGFDSLWTVEHVAVPVGYESAYPYDRSGKMPGGEKVDLPDPLVWLSYVAACTSRISLGTGILILPQRNPIVVAKEIATLDLLSEGRVLLGVGVGWLAEEFAALGVPFEGRGRRTDEYIDVLRALWSEREATHHGELVDFDRLVSRPKPVRGSVPIIVGGHTDAAAKRAGRLGDGFFPGRGRIERLRSLIGLMRETAEQSGRDPASIEVTAGTAGVFGDDPLGAVAELAEVGVDRIVVPSLTNDPDAVADVLAQFRADVLDKVG